MTTARAPESPWQWLEWIADADSLRPLRGEVDVARRSPFLARWSIDAHVDDGIQLASFAVDGRRVLAAAQDARFLGGSVGAGHATALARLCDEARATRTPIVLLLASGGVRLHEANPAEVALARAVGALIDARASGLPVLALAIGDVFGGASVIGCATDRLGMLPSARLGLSGPKVIAIARGVAELDPSDAQGINALFAAASRARDGDADVVACEREAIRAWIARSFDARMPFHDAVQASQARLARKLGAAESALQWWVPAAWRARLLPVASGAGVWRTKDECGWVVGAPGDTALSPEALLALDAALLERVLPNVAAGDVMVLVEDSRGHEVSRRAEAICISRFLAHHACVLGLIRASGVVIRAALAGQGHSAAFFVNALQAQYVIAAQDASVMAMNPDAVARVTGLRHEALIASIDTDPVLGHRASLFAHWGGIAALVPEFDEATLDRLLRV